MINQKLQTDTVFSFTPNYSWGEGIPITPPVCRLSVCLVQPRRLVTTFIGTRPTPRLAQMRVFIRTDEKIEEKNLVRQVFFGLECP